MTTTRLDVEKAVGAEGLKRSHSCSEMRRRTVLAEWELVTTTTTSTQVIVTEATASQNDDNTSKDSWVLARNLQIYCRV